MSHIVREHLVPIAQSKQLPGSPSESSVRRWVRKGVLGKKSGKVHKLQVVYIGSSPYTSIEAFERWVDRVTEDFSRD